MFKFKFTLMRGFAERNIKGRQEDGGYSRSPQSLYTNFWWRDVHLQSLGYLWVNIHRAWGIGPGESQLLHLFLPKLVLGVQKMGGGHAFTTPHEQNSKHHHQSALRARQCGREDTAQTHTHTIAIHQGSRHEGGPKGFFLEQGCPW